MLFFIVGLLPAPLHIRSVQCVTVRCHDGRSKTRAGGRTVFKFMRSEDIFRRIPATPHARINTALISRQLQQFTSDVGGPGWRGGMPPGCIPVGPIIPGPGGPGGRTDPGGPGGLENSFCVV